MEEVFLCLFLTKAGGAVVLALALLLVAIVGLQVKILRMVGKRGAVE